MLDETKAHRRLYLVMTLVAVVVLLAGGIAWKSIAYPTPVAPSLVRVEATQWVVAGCAASSFLGPGFVIPSSSTVVVNGSVENLNASSTCTISGLAVGEGGFSLVSDSVPSLLGPFGSPSDNGTLQATLIAPSGWHTFALELILLGSEGA